IEILEIDLIDNCPGHECCNSPSVLLKGRQHSALSKKDGMERNATSNEQDNGKSKKNQFQTDIELHLSLSSASTNFRTFSNCAVDELGTSSNIVARSNSFSALLPSCDRSICIKICLILVTSFGARSAR